MIRNVTIDFLVLYVNMLSSATAHSTNANVNTVLLNEVSRAMHTCNTIVQERMLVEYSECVIN